MKMHLWVISFAVVLIILKIGIQGKIPWNSLIKTTSTVADGGFRRQIVNYTDLADSQSRLLN